MTVRRKFIAGNWKLNLGPAEAARLAEGLREKLATRGDVEVAVFPTRGVDLKSGRPLGPSGGHARDRARPAPRVNHSRTTE